jgi:methionyl-tRNA synthetase
MSNRILVTSALPYCNNIPHLGNIIGSLLSGDIYARFKRLQGYDVLHVSGSDNYGTVTEIKALQENLTCEEICEKYNRIHKNIYDWFNINFDVWGSTSNGTQIKLTQEIFLALYKNGFIEEQTMEQMYCPKCEKFIADRFLKGTCYHKECEGKNSITNGDQCDTCQKFIDVDKIKNPFCFICKRTPFLKESEHLFLKLNDLTEDIRKYNLENNRVKLNDQCIAIVNSWLNMGLKSRCITRDIKWGVPVPWEYDDTLKKYKGKVFYVWFDAPVGYFSIIKHDREDWRDWVNGDIEWIQTMSSDNIPFHTLLFTGSILGSKLDLPLHTAIASTYYLLYEDQKFSKSNNIGIFGDQVASISKELGINEDYWRFYLTKIRPENHDSSFDWKEFVATTNTDLVNNIGNYVNRCVSMSNKFCEGNTLYTFNNNLATLLQNIINDYNDAFNNFRFKDALFKCLILSAHGNKYLQEQKPWMLAKDNEIHKIKNILGNANLIAKILAIMLEPIMPKTAQFISNVFQTELNCKPFEIPHQHHCVIKIGPDYKLLFKPIKSDEIENVLNKLNISSNLT